MTHVCDVISAKCISLEIQNERAYWGTHTRICYQKSLTGYCRQWVKNKLINISLYCWNAFKMSKGQLLMTVTSYDLFFAHCVNSSVIVLDFSIFLPKLCSLRKKSQSKTVTWFQKMTSKKMVHTYYCLIKSFKNLFHCSAGILMQYKLWLPVTAP